MRSRADVESEELENFEEALRAVNTALQPSVIPGAVESIVQDPKCLHLTNKSEDFWILARGLKDFLESTENPKLPLPGSLPDMFADSARYIKLANIYRNQAAVDSEKIHKYVQTHLESIGRSAVIYSLLLLSSLYHTVLNLHFLSKNSTLISRENCRFFRGEKLAKMLWFWTF